MMKKNVISLGTRIREVRLAKKMTQSDVVGDYMTRNMLSKIENGSATPSVRTLEYLATSLDVPVSYFLDGEDRDPLDTEQLREIDELSKMLLEYEADCVPALSLCIRARTRLAAGRSDAALSLFDGLDVDEHPRIVHDDIYAVIEDCYRLKRNFRMAYEYALKRLAEPREWD